MERGGGRGAGGDTAASLGPESQHQVLLSTTPHALKRIINWRRGVKDLISEKAVRNSPSLSGAWPCNHSVRRC